ncbi:DUF4238 domain-containing protein [Rhizobium sp. RAF56]|uniref:DUF4238 domain-containing protein n=1 Tax=Rhizobium sp. RAF56 TaxID=3233062 RepID=UPI003F9CBC15
MKHHYIPQFYLRPWLGADYKLQEFRRGYGDRIQTGRYGTLSTGYAENLYTLPGVTEETKQNVERFFMSFVDNAAVKARDMMLEDRIPKDPEIRHSWARFILSLVFRNPEELRKFKGDFSKRLLTPDTGFQARYEAYRSADDPETFEEWIVQRAPSHAERESVMAMTRLVENKNVLRLLRTMHWVVMDTSRVTRKLMTSDRPVVMTNGFVQYAGHYGIPIGPTRLFIAFTSVAFAEKFCALPEGKIVREVNDAVIGQARKYVYGLDKANLAEVRRRMGKREAPSFVSPQ